MCINVYALYLIINDFEVTPMMGKNWSKHRPGVRQVWIREPLSKKALKYTSRPYIQPGIARRSSNFQGIMPWWRGVWSPRQHHWGRWILLMLTGLMQAYGVCHEVALISLQSPCIVCGAMFLKRIVIFTIYRLEFDSICGNLYGNGMLTYGIWSVCLLFCSYCVFLCVIF